MGRGGPPRRPLPSLSVSPAELPWIAELNALLGRAGVGGSDVLDVLARDEVDVETLRLFQEDDYDELGISIGARRKIAAQLRRQEARATRPPLAPRSSSTASSEPSGRGETARRVATPPRPSTPITAESRHGSTQRKRQAASRSPQATHRPPPQVQSPPHAALRESPERARPVHAVNGVRTSRRSPRRTAGGTGAALTTPRSRSRGRGGRRAKGSHAQEQGPRSRGRGRQLPKAAAVGPVAEPPQDRLAPLFDALLSAGAERGGARVDSMVALLARSQ